MNEQKTKIKEELNNILRWSEKYTKTDMVYLVGSTFWVGISKLFIFLFSFLLMFAFSHLASKETFGSYQYILSILTIVSIASLPGLNISLIKSIAQQKDGTFLEVIKSRIKWSFLGSLVLISMSIWYLYQSNIILGISLFLVGIFLPFFQSYETYEYFWNGKKKFKKSMLYTTISSVIPLFFLILTLFFTENLIIIMLVFLTSNSLVRGIFTKITLKQIKNREIDKNAITLGKSLTIIQGIDIASNYIDKIFIWKILGPIQLAIYSFVQIPINKMMQLAPIQTISLPKLSEQNIQQDKKEIIKKFLKLFIIIIPITILFIIFAPLLYTFFFPQYKEAIPYVQVLGSLIVLMPFTFINTAMIANGMGKELTGIQSIVFISKVILFFILMPNYGIWGVIYATILTESLKSILTLFIFKKSYKKIIL